MVSVPGLELSKRHLPCAAKHIEMNQITFLVYGACAFTLLMLLVIVVHSYLLSRAFSGNLHREIWLILMRICSMRIRMFAWSPGRQEARLLLVDQFFGFAVLHFPLACLFPFPTIPISFPFLRLLPIFLSLPLWSPSHSLAHRPLKIVACLYFFICPLCCAFAPPQSCCCKAGRGLGITGHSSILTFSFPALFCGSFLIGWSPCQHLKILFLY